MFAKGQVENTIFFKKKGRYEERPFQEPIEII